jgi:hypothetical protein
MSIEPPQRSRPLGGRARPAQSIARARRDRVAPLYDPAFEHDACGIGFVADAGGKRLAEVLPLALGGLAALAHRGAFGADGASSDGAGVSIPLDPMASRFSAGGPSRPTPTRSVARRGPVDRRSSRRSSAGRWTRAAPR